MVRRKQGKIQGGNYPDFWKKALSSSHRCIGRQPCVNPNMADVFFVKGEQGAPVSPVP